MSAVASCQSNRKLQISHLHPAAGHATAPASANSPKKPGPGSKAGLLCGRAEPCDSLQASQDTACCKPTARRISSLGRNPSGLPGQAGVAVFLCGISWPEIHVPAPRSRTRSELDRLCVRRVSCMPSSRLRSVASFRQPLHNWEPRISKHSAADESQLQLCWGCLESASPTPWLRHRQNFQGWKLLGQGGPRHVVPAVCPPPGPRPGDPASAGPFHMPASCWPAWLTPALL